MSHQDEVATAQQRSMEAADLAIIFQTSPCKFGNLARAHLALTDRLAAVEADRDFLAAALAAALRGTS